MKSPSTAVPSALAQSGYLSILSWSSLIAIALAPLGISAVIGPDAYGYQAQNLSSTFEDISTTGTRVLVGVDDSTVSTSLDYNFVFYGISYSSVFVSSNGLLTFGSGDASFSNSNLATSPPPGNLPTISVLWDDWQSFQIGSDAVYLQTSGVAGQRRFIAQWNNVYGYASSPSAVTFQAVLFEEDNSILFRYLDVDSGDARSSGAQATIGISNANGNSTGEYLQWSFDGTNTVGNGDAIHFGLIPEPSTTLLSTVAMIGLLVRRRRQ